MGATSAGTDTGFVHFLNLEYFFRLIYDTVLHGNFSATGLLPWFASIWSIVTGAAFLLSIAAFIGLIYALVRLRQLEEEEASRYSTLDPSHAIPATEHSRWAHVMTLIESAHESDWRQAIIEADIMLDEELTHHGLSGDTVGDKLKNANFASLQDAWEAHKIRNDIAHQGAEFKLDGHEAFRTIQKFERVFKELGAI